MQTPQQFFKSRNIALLGQQHHQNFVLIDRTHHYEECGNAPECSNRIVFICSTHRPSNAPRWKQAKRVATEKVHRDGGYLSKKTSAPIA
jgi:hypothetical protein